MLQLQYLRAVHLISKDCLNTDLLVQLLQGVFCKPFRIDCSDRLPTACHPHVGIIINADSYDNSLLFEHTRNCYKRFPEVRVIIFNASAESTPLEISEWPNVKAVFYNTASVEAVERGFKAVDMGYLWIPRPYSEHVINKLRVAKEEETSEVKLTQREIQIVKLLSEGMSNENIADNLSISHHTVKTHLYKVYKKLNVKNRFEAFAWVAKNRA